jgi:peptide/nickel transport system permease protein
MLRFALRRLLLAIVTLFILIVVIFILTRAFPGDPAQRIAGPFAAQERVEEVRETLGLDESLPTQFVNLLGDTVTFDFGNSFANPDQTVVETIRPALWRSTKLVMLALVMTLPISILGGIVAARKKDTLVDRSIVTLGLASASIPEFVSGVILQYILGVRLKSESGIFGLKTDFFPAVAIVPEDAGIFTEIRYLLLPALAIVFVYFGYIARVTRAGTISALDADYSRTAFMKGLSTRKVVSRHVLRNALQPTVAVTGTQVGYLFGGLVGLEIVFEYNGLGRLILTSATLPDFPVLQAGVLVIAIIFMFTTLFADLLIAYMNPRARLNGSN